MFRLRSVMEIHFVDRRGTFVTPWMIVGIVAVAVFGISLIITTVGGFSPATIQRTFDVQIWNGAVWSLLGMLVGVGGATMGQYLSFGLGFGLTRREYILGSALVFVIMAGASAVLVTVMNVIEQATTGFGVGMRMFSAIYIGTGPWWQTLIQTFIVCMLLQLLGALISTIWNRWGKTGMLIMTAALLIVGVIIGAVGFLNLDALAAAWTFVVELSWLAWMGIATLTMLLGAAAWYLMGRFTQVR